MNRCELANRESGNHVGQASGSQVPDQADKGSQRVVARQSKAPVSRFVTGDNVLPSFTLPVPVLAFAKSYRWAVALSADVRVGEARESTRTQSHSRMWDSRGGQFNL